LTMNLNSPVPYCYMNFSCVLTAMQLIQLLEYSQYRRYFWAFWVGRGYMYMRYEPEQASLHDAKYFMIELPR